MSATRALHELGQSLWIDNITRQMLDDGTLERYVADLDVTGLTSNPTIFEKAISGGAQYDDQMAELTRSGASPEDVFFNLAVADLRRAADFLRDVHERTSGVDGFVSLEVSPVLAYDTDATLAQARDLARRMDRPNVFIKIPGTPPGLPAIEEAIYEGIPINVTLLFSPAQYLACSEAYTRGIERRVAAGRSGFVPSVASVFLSRWDTAAADRLPKEHYLKLGLAMGRRLYGDYRRFYAMDRWQRLLNAGARPQRLLFASTGTKDPDASPTLYVEGLAAPHTVNTMPEPTLLALAKLEGWRPKPLDAAPRGDELAPFISAGLDVEGLGLELQEKGAESFVKSWDSLIEHVGEKAGAVAAGA